MSEFLRRRDVSPRASAPPEVLEVNRVDRERVPALLEFITCDVWPDGQARQPGTLLIFLDDYRVKVCLSDRDQGAVLFLTADCLMSVLQAADEALRDPSSDWRPSRKTSSRRSGK